MPIRSAIFSVVFLLTFHQVNAASVLTPLSNGQSSLLVAPSDSFVLDIVLTTNSSDANTSVVFDVVFSQPGLQLDSYQWGGSYAGSIFDNSDPLKIPKPFIVRADTRGDTSSPVDLHFENFSTTPFTTGTLVSLNMTVPSNFNFSASVTIGVVVDTVEGNSGAIVTSAGSDFRLTTVPLPSAAWMGLGLLVCVIFAGRLQKMGFRPSTQSSHRGFIA